MKNTILVFLSLMIACYLGMSFIMWQLNPGLWTECSRLIFMYIALIISIFGAGLYMINKNN